MNIRSLDVLAREHHANAEGKRRLAEDSRQKAEQYEADGDPAKAAIERKAAETFQSEADAYDNQGGQLEAQLLILQRRANDLEKQKEAEQKRHEEAMKALDQEERSVLG